MVTQEKNGDFPCNSARQLKILIVDDKRENRYLLESMLGAEGFNTESASNGIDALALLKKQHFDAIISDLLMPKMDGFALIRACKKDPALSKIPFIIYTATYTETKDVNFGLSLGAARYIIKPAEPDVLLRELKGTLGQVAGEVMEEPKHLPLDNGKADQEYVRRLVAKLDKKVLDLEKSEERYRTVFENTGTATVVIGENNIIALANAEFVKLSGFSRDEIEKKKSWTEFVVEEDLERMLAHHRLRRKDHAKALPHYEFRFVTRSGDIRTIYLTIDTIPGTGESIASLLDITDRKKAEASLKESNDRFRLLFEQSPVPYQSLDADERFLQVNDAWLTLLGYTRDEVIGHWFGDFIAPAYSGVFRENFLKFKAAGETHVEFAMKRKDGSLIIVAFDGKVGHYPDGSFRQMHCVWRDITREKQAEETLKEREYSYRTLAENLPGIVYRVHVREDGRMQFFNAMLTVMTGYTEEELSQGKICSIEPLIVPGDRDRVIMDVDAAIREKRSFQTEYSLAHKNGDLRVFVERGKPIFDDEGLVYIDGIIQDITDKKQTEKARERLLHDLAQKNTELDRFTYTVSHDLKSPLLAMRAFLALLEEDLKSGDTAQATNDIMRISESAEKLEHLINTLLELSRSGRSVDTPVRVPFADLARDAARLLDTTLKKHSISLVISESMPVVAGDPQRLMQVMTNLIDNAVKFMGVQPQPQVEVGVQPGDNCTIFFVRDNGMGIEKENLSKVFGLYERLNPDLPGTGIGLATVKRIIEAHGGKIWVESEGEGKGTTVCFTLPVVGNKAEKNT